MHDDELREMLEQVKAGELTPEDAAARLQVHRETEARAGWSGAYDETREHEFGADPPVAEPEAPYRAVRIRATANRTIVTGDPRVRTVRVEGHHRLRDEGDVLVVESDAGHTEDGFGFAGFRLHNRGKGFVLHRMPESAVLRIQVNPELPLDIECDAGSVTASGLGGPVQVRVNAGSARVEGVDGEFVGIVNAGNLRARGRLRGESRVECSAGRIDLELEDSTAVKVVRTVNLGSVDIDPGLGGEGPDVLQVVCNLGSVRVRAAGSDDRHRHGHARARGPR